MESLKDKIGFIKDAALAVENYEDLVSALDEDFTENFYNKVDFIYKNEYNKNANHTQMHKVADEIIAEFTERFKDNKYITIKDTEVIFSTKIKEGEK